MAEQLSRLCHQLLLPEGVSCCSPQQSEGLLKSLYPLFFCSTPFPSSCAMTMVLAVVQFPSAVRTLRCCSLLLVGWVFLLLLEFSSVKANCKSSMHDACYWSKKIRKVSMGFPLCTVVTLSEKEPQVQGNQTKGCQNIWILWSSCENFYGIAHYPSLSFQFWFRIAGVLTLYKYLVQNAAKSQGIVSWLTHTWYLAVKETLRMEPGYMSMKQVSSYTSGFQKLIL